VYKNIQNVKRNFSTNNNHFYRNENAHIHSHSLTHTTKGINLSANSLTPFCHEEHCASLNYDQRLLAHLNFIEELCVNMVCGGLVSCSSV